GNAVNLTTTSAADGTFSFTLLNPDGSPVGGIRPGTYKLSGVGVDGTQDIYFAGTIGGCSGDVPLPGQPALHSISGYTFRDDNNDGIFQSSHLTVQANIGGIVGASTSSFGAKTAFAGLFKASPLLKAASVGAAAVATEPAIQGVTVQLF